ncbi:hypothetical protein G7046_g5808 [Stylonectria norvegica]|nr:hypothetical protein G7046_g5808 [Stylonectria norvegica]
MANTHISQLDDVTRGFHTLQSELLSYCKGVENSLLKENEELSRKLKNAELDLDDAVSSRRDLQQRVNTIESHLEWIAQENDSLKNRNPYVLVLIDGDGLIFQEHLIKQGLEGGKKAAYALRTAVSAQCGKHASEMEIVAKVVANVAGLGRAMCRDGSLDNMQDLKEFTLGFTQAKASFDFIDVGYGKERADSKIKELTRWNLRNHNCKQILLGISHDAGYAPFLDEVRRDDATRKQITVLEGFPTVRELKATGVNVLDFSDAIFRRNKLVDRVSTPGPFSAAPPVQPIVSPPESISSTSPVATSSSYAVATTSVTPPPQLVLPLAPKTNTAARSRMAPAAWSPSPRGLDAPIAVSLQGMESIKKRKENKKLCNNHFLRGPCSKGDMCNFVHNYRPSAEELKAIAALSRLNPCTMGQDCEMDDCIYGHHCPTTSNGYCSHPYCKFPVDGHAPGTKFKNPNIRDN